jgi:RimJ/RimL family protein N-acetyltransferase
VKFLSFLIPVFLFCTSFDPIPKDIQVEITSSDTRALDVRIQTPRLTLRSAQTSDFDAYCSLYCNEETMTYYVRGTPKTPEWVTSRLSCWVQRWIDGDPFSALAIFKEEEFIGHIVMGYGDRPGQSEIAFVILPEYWMRGYGTEAVEAVLKHYAPEIARRQVKVNGAPLEVVEATTKPDNIAANKILMRYMSCDRQEYRYDGIRNVYALQLN